MVWFVFSIIRALTWFPSTFVSRSDSEGAIPCTVIAHSRPWRIHSQSFKSMCKQFNSFTKTNEDVLLKWNSAHKLCRLSPAQKFEEVDTPILPLNYCCDAPPLICFQTTKTESKSFVLIILFLFCAQKRIMSPKSMRPSLSHRCSMCSRFCFGNTQPIACFILLKMCSKLIGLFFVCQRTLPINSACSENSRSLTRRVR